LLQNLSQTPLIHRLLFRGASALHGVYLHERYSEDLDFFAASELASTAVAAFGAAGLTLEERPDAVPVYVCRGAVHTRVELGVDVIAMHYPEESFLVPETATYRGIAGETATVRTYPLSALLARKLRYAMRRRFAVDFFDLWIGLEKRPECAPEMQEIVRRRELGGAGGERYRAEGAVASFAGLEATWHDELHALMPRVPDYETVRRDLTHWLPLFESRG
jgi:hypothetical protein